MASRLTKEKNIGFAIGAMKCVVKKHPKAGLVIVGLGPEEEKLRTQIFKSKIGENVKIENWTNDLTSYYKTADLFLLASNYEGYGRTIIEALASGCNVVSSDVGIATEVLGDDHIFRVKKRKELENKIMGVINKEIKMTNQDFLTKLPSKEEYLKKYKESWEKCCSIV